jgi:hypothetical protein
LSRNILLDLFSYSYLLILFLIFTFGWLRLPISLLVLAVFIYLAWRNRPALLGSFHVSVLIKPAAIISAVFLGVWVFLSGVGGYAFQNLDFLSKNAIFRDLIQHHWPLIYLANPNKPLHALWIWLLIGALTPLYEINRSIYRTTAYYSNVATHNPLLAQAQSTQTTSFIPFEDILPSNLVADGTKSLSTLKPPDSLTDRTQRLVFLPLTHKSYCHTCTAFYTMII